MFADAPSMSSFLSRSTSPTNSKTRGEVWFRYLVEQIVRPSSRSKLSSPHTVFRRCGPSAKLLVLGASPNTTCWCGKRLPHLSATGGNQHALRSLVEGVALVGHARSGPPHCVSTHSACSGRTRQLLPPIERPHGPIC